MQMTEGIKELTKVLQPHENEIQEIQEGYIGVSKNKGKWKIITLHKTENVELKK